MSTYPTFLAGQRATSALLTSMQQLMILKTADETVSNSTTFQDDNELVLAVEANATYFLQAFLKYQSIDTADIKIQWTYPTGTTMAWAGLGLSSSASSTPGDWQCIHRTEAEQLALGGVGSTSPIVATPTGLVTVSSTAGSLKLQWAQNSAIVSNTKMLAGSWLMLTRYA